MTFIIELEKTNKQKNQPFRATQGGVHTALFLIPVVTYREANTMSGALEVLQMKEEHVFKFLAAGTHLSGTNLDFQTEQYIYKRKVMVSTSQI
jgi:hypothetical protein